MDNNVPCNGCTHCCRNDIVRLLPEDDASQYKTAPHPGAHEYGPIIPGMLMLAHAPNGDCIYLGKNGCTIHHTKPLMCREMDCRNIARAITWTQARKMSSQGWLNMAVWRRGKELLREI